jgi:hypothetical protein
LPSYQRYILGWDNKILLPSKYTHHSCGLSELHHTRSEPVYPKDYHHVPVTLTRASKCSRHLRGHGRGHTNSKCLPGPPGRGRVGLEPKYFEGAAPGPPTAGGMTSECFPLPARPRPWGLRSPSALTVRPGPRVECFDRAGPGPAGGRGTPSSRKFRSIRGIYNGVTGSVLRFHLGVYMFENSRYISLKDPTP